MADGLTRPDPDSRRCSGSAFRPTYLSNEPLAANAFSPREETVRLWRSGCHSLWCCVWQQQKSAATQPWLTRRRNHRQSAEHCEDQYGSTVPPVIVFDVNETLLDLSPLRSWFRERFGEGPDASTWFSELLRLSFISSLTNLYQPFTELAASALETVAARAGVRLEKADIALIKGVLATLPPHPDAPVGLRSLRKAGFTVAALTNSPLSTAHAQLTHAGLAESLDVIMSVDMVRRFKPHHSVYEAAASRLNIRTGEMVMVAAHDWDVAGALAVGAAGVFIARHGQLYSPSFTPPTHSAPDIEAAANILINRYV